MKQLPIHIKVKFKVCQKTFQIIKQRDAYHTDKAEETLCTRRLRYVLPCINFSYFYPWLSDYQFKSPRKLYS